MSQTTLSQKLSVDSLLSMTPLVGDRDIVSEAARALFASTLRSQPSVNEIFFPDHRPDLKEASVDPDWFDFDTFAVLYVCQCLAKARDEFDIFAMIDEAKPDNAIEMACASGDWKKVGFAMYTMLFPDLVHDAAGIPFSAYRQEENRKEWAAQLSARVTESRNVYSLLRPVLTGTSDGDYNRELNVVFIKLHLLDPTSVLPAYCTLSKALPQLSLQLVTTNYLGPPPDWRDIMPYVQRAIGRCTAACSPTKRRPNFIASAEDMEVYYGVEVIEFIMKEAKELELTTGKEANNARKSPVKDRCIIS